VKRIDRKRLEALQKAQEMAQFLTKDLAIASEQSAEKVKSKKPADSLKWAVVYLGKTALRTLFSHVEALSYTLRFIAVDYAPDLGVEIPDREPLALQALRGTKDGKPEPIHPVESLKAAFQYFPSLFGVRLDLDLSTEDAKAFLALEDLRNEMAFPTTIEQLAGKEIPSYWIPGSSWYLARINDLFRLCAQQIPDADVADQKLELPADQVVERLTAGSTEADKAVEPSSLRTPEHVKLALELLTADTSRAMGLSTKMAILDDLQATHGQFGMRNLVRTVFSEVDVTIAIAVFILFGSADPSQPALLEKDIENLLGRVDADQQLLDIANLWSTELGDQTQKKVGGKKWDLFRQGLKVRDRIAHPRSIKELRVSVDEASIILGAQDWHREISGLLIVDAEKWPKIAPEQAVPEPGDLGASEGGRDVPSPSTAPFAGQ
jgi:hypothetical protein